MDSLQKKVLLLSWRWKNNVVKICMGKGKTVLASELVGESVTTIGPEKDCFVGADTKEVPNFEVWEEEFIKEERISTDTENSHKLKIMKEM
jgi:hypothetical protein